MGGDRPLDFDFIPELLRADPGSLQFTEYVERFLESEKILEAIHISQIGLSHNPDCYEGRLLLAQAYYKSGAVPFAVREIEHLVAKLPENEHLEKLLAKLAPDRVSLTKAHSKKPGVDPVKETKDHDETVAESEFNLDELDLLNDD